MAGARDHRHEQDDTAGPAGIARRGVDPDHAPAIAGPADPRLTHGGAEAGLMRLQRTAGNAAVASMVAPAVQRAVSIDEITSEVDTAEPESGGDATTGPEATDGGPTTINGSQINLDAPIVTAPGIVRASTIIVDNVIATNYTPGAGNLF